MEFVRLAFRAMATRFEFVLCGADEPFLRAAGEEAIREVKRIEERCNFYSPASELSRLNREASDAPVRCSGMMMRLLLRCQDLNEDTGGRFDPTVAPALATWGLRSRMEGGRIPTPAELEELTRHIGFQHVHVDQTSQTVHFTNPGVQLDLGGIAKGWALDESLLLLEESGVQHALLHGGTSTAIALGSGPDDAPWKIGIKDPYERSDEPAWLFAVPLSSAALSVSGVHGKSFIDQYDQERVEYGHVIDPLTGRAVSGPRLALAVTESASASDAWSTALLARPTTSVPDHVMGTAFLKTDSGWTVTAGAMHPTWESTGSGSSPSTQPAD